MTRASRLSIAWAMVWIFLTAPALAQQTAAPPAVTVVKVEQREITPAVTFTGRIEANCCS